MKARSTAFARTSHGMCVAASTTGAAAADWFGAQQVGALQRQDRAVHVHAVDFSRRARRSVLPPCAHPCWVVHRDVRPGDLFAELVHRLLVAASTSPRRSRAFTRRLLPPPRARCAVDELCCACQVDADGEGPLLPLNTNDPDEYRPFTRRVGEFQFWFVPPPLAMRVCWFLLLTGVGGYVCSGTSLPWQLACASS